MNKYLAIGALGLLGCNGSKQAMSVEDATKVLDDYQLEGRADSNKFCEASEFADDYLEKKFGGNGGAQYHYFLGLKGYFSYLCGERDSAYGDLEKAVDFFSADSSLNDNGKLQEVYLSWVNQFTDLSVGNYNEGGEVNYLERAEAPLKKASEFAEGENRGYVLHHLGSLYKELGLHYIGLAAASSDSSLKGFYLEKSRKYFSGSRKCLLEVESNYPSVHNSFNKVVDNVTDAEA